jgi:hypothetical protein
VALSSGVKLLEREAAHLPPSSAEVNHGGAICPLHHTSSWLGAYLSVGTTLPFTFLRQVIYEDNNESRSHSGDYEVNKPRKKPA